MLLGNMLILMERYLQKTCFTYMNCHDQLFNTCYNKNLLELFDENKDGVIDYDEKGSISNIKKDVPNSEHPF